MTTTTTTTFELITNHYYNKDEHDTKCAKYTKSFATMPLDELKTAYKHIAYRMHNVSNKAYFKMLPAKNAMYRALVARGVTSTEIAKLS